MPKPPPDPDKIATILAFALAEGDENACKQFRISARTLVNYKNRAKNNCVIAEKCADKRQAIVEGWIEKAKAARAMLLERVQALAATSDNLHDVTGAYKIVNDGILAEQVVGEGSDGGRTGAGAGMEGAGSPAATAQGAEPRIPDVH